MLLGRSGNFEMVVFGVLMVLLLQFARDGRVAVDRALAAAARGRRRSPMRSRLPARDARAVLDRCSK